jgi:hypothetical protein
LVEWLWLSIFLQRADSNRTKAIPFIELGAASRGMLGRMLRRAYRVENTAGAAMISNLFNLPRREAGIH